MRGVRPLYNSSIAQELGYLPLESASGIAAVNVSPSTATVVTRTTGPTLSLQAITVTPNGASIVVKGGVPTLQAGANALPISASIVTKAGVPTLVLGAISVIPAKGTVATKVGSPTLVLGAITVTPNKGTITTKGGIPILSGIPIDVYPDLGTIVVTASEPTIEYIQPFQPGGHGQKPVFWTPKPKPPTQLEKELKAMVEVYKTEASLKAQEHAQEVQRLQTLEMGRRQMEINRALNKGPKERPQVAQKPLIDEDKLRKLVERAEKQRQEEIALANKVKMAKVRAAKRKPGKKR